MNVVIQKFGGSSLSTAEKRKAAADKVLNSLRAGYMPVVVVSAMGRAGDVYATDTLIELARLEHNDPSPRALDMAMACGELLSAVVFAGVLRRHGYEAVPLSGGMAGLLTDEQYGQAHVLSVDASRLKSLVEQGRIPVVAGFQGQTAQGDMTTLGRGGSDTTASLLGEALGAECVEIYTDVDGIMTADPRLVPDAQVLRHISYGEVFQIADQGAKVIHPGAVSIAMRAGIPLVIRNTANDFPGTIISNRSGIHEVRVISSITYMPQRCQVELDAEIAGQRQLLEELAENAISIDLINMFPDRLVFTVAENDCARVEALCAGFSKMRRGCAKVSVIGEGMKGVPGIMVSILRALDDAGVKVLQTADSHSTISCLVAATDTTAAVLALHEKFVVG